MIDLWVLHNGNQLKMNKKPIKCCSWTITFFRGLIHLIIFVTFIYLTIRWFNIHWDDKQKIIDTKYNIYSSTI